MASNYFGYDYFCGANVHISIAGQPVYEVAGIRYQEESSTMPIYGYSSRIFDAVATGQKIIKGHFIINFIHPNYIADILNNGFRAAALEQRKAEFDRRIAGVDSALAPVRADNEYHQQLTKLNVKDYEKDIKDADAWLKQYKKNNSNNRDNIKKLYDSNSNFKSYIDINYFDPNIPNFTPLMTQQEQIVNDFIKYTKKEIGIQKKDFQENEQLIENEKENRINKLDADFNGVSQAQIEVERLLDSLSNYGGTYSYSDKARKMASLEKELTDYFQPTEQSTSTPLRVNDVGLLGPFNLDIKFAREYTIKIIDCFITSRGSIIQIDESSVVEEYSFFAREIAYT